MTMNVLAIGATSAIAEAALRRWAPRGGAFRLLARREPLLEAIAQDLRVRGAAAATWEGFDVSRIAEHGGALDRAWAALGTVDCVLVAHGTLPDQAACERSVEATLEALAVNGTATCALMAEVANRLAEQGRGTLAVVTSVAGERGRASNYTYGAAKAMVSTFASGLRHRFHASGVRVVDIRPGFVDTPMTAAFPKGPLWASPARVAAVIERAVDRGTAVAYAPGFWRLVMAVIRALPRPVFDRLKL